MKNTIKWFCMFAAAILVLATLDGYAGDMTGDPMGSLTGLHTVVVNNYFYLMVRSGFMSVATTALSLFVLTVASFAWLMFLGAVRLRNRADKQSAKKE